MKITLYPEGGSLATGETRFIWVLCHIDVQFEPASTPVTLPVPIQDRAISSLDTLVNGMAAGGILEARIGALYGADWLAGRTWSLSSKERLTPTQAAALFPNDPFSGGRFVCVDWGNDR